MGGSGSGRWGWHFKKTTIEQCVAIDSARWTKEESSTRVALVPVWSPCPLSCQHYGREASLREP